MTAIAGDLDDERLDDARLNAAVKPVDGFFATFCVSPYSKHIARWAARRGIAPNTVTVAAMGVGALAAGAFASGQRPGLVAGAALLQAAFTLDCVDGQLARYTQRFSALGARLDAVFDRTKEHLVYAGLAVGAARAGAPVWTLATATLGLQTARHMLDYATIAARGPAQPAAAAPARPTPWTWAKRLASFPIGERFAVISATAAVATPRTTFTVLLAWGGVGVVYMLAGRLRAPVDPGARPALAALRDDGPLARALLRGRLPLPVAWAAPGAVRAAEYGGLLWLAARAGGSAVPACFGLLCALAYHHYDVAYRRQMAGRTPPAWLNAAALGWEGRLLAAAALAAGGTLAAGYAAGAAVLAAVFVGESLTGWSRAAAPAPEPACPC